MKGLRRKSVRILAVFLVLCGSIGEGVCALETLSNEFFAEFLVGNYKVVGRKVDSQETYTGSVTISPGEGVLEMRRDIQGRKTVARAEIVKSRVEGTPVLQVTFEEAGATYEGSYVWSSDLDNYARISGYIVKRGEKTDNPGMECLFIDHSAQ
ncbi:MAG: hypothetical protein HGA63_04295 [Syntrophobacteraceae bacterium]|nr:hypothetical protein [Syntrophobacteraceae bacterium]